MRRHIIFCLVSLILSLDFMPAVGSETSRTIKDQPRAEEPVPAVKSDPEQSTDFLFFKINYVYRPQGKGSFEVLKNGSALHSGDHYKIIFTPNQDCYVYIFQVDSANKVYSLFPMQKFGKLMLNNVNPLQSGQTYYIPAEGKSFILDDQVGTERIYFLASFERDLELEAQYQRAFEAQQQRDVEEQLQQIDALLKYATELTGEAGVVFDPAETETTTWQEGGELFSVLRQRLEDMCNGCVHVLTFTHQ